MEPESRFDRVMSWALFVLPAVCGTLWWVQRDRFGDELAFLAWGVRAARRPPPDLRSLRADAARPLTGR